MKELQNAEGVLKPQGSVNLAKGQVGLLNSSPKLRILRRQNIIKAKASRVASPSDKGRTETFLIEYVQV